MSNFDITLYNTNNNNNEFNPETDKNNLEDRLFFTLLNKNLNHCIDKPVDNIYCDAFYKNINNKINSSFINEYSNSLSHIHSNPTENVYYPFPNLDTIKCVPEHGKNRTKTAYARYTFPIYNEHHPYIAQGFPNDLNNIKALKPNTSKFFTNIQTKEIVKFTRKNDTSPESYHLEIIYSCPDNPYRTTADLDNLWKEKTNCSVQLKDILPVLNTTYDKLQYNPNLTEINNIFNPYSKKSLYNLQISSNKQNCYGSGKYLPIDATDLCDSKGNILPGIFINYTLLQGTEFSNAKGSVPIVFLNDFKLWFQKDGNLVLYHKDRAVWHTATFTSGDGILRMQYDGNLTLNFPNKKGDWASGTYGHSNVAFLSLSSNGDLNIKDIRDGKIIKAIHKSDIKVTEPVIERTVERGAEPVIERTVERGAEPVISTAASTPKPSVSAYTYSTIRDVDRR